MLNKVTDSTAENMTQYLYNKPGVSNVLKQRTLYQSLTFYTFDNSRITNYEVERNNINITCDLMLKEEKWKKIIKVMSCEFMRLLGMFAR